MSDAKTLDGTAMMPEFVIATIRAAVGGTENDTAPIDVRAAIEGLLFPLPWLIASVYDAASPAEYAYFQGLLSAKLASVWAIAEAENPRATLEEELAAGMENRRRQFAKKPV